MSSDASSPTTDPRAILTGAIGLAPSEIDMMTPKEVVLAMHGYRQAEKARWARTLRISQALGDKLTVDRLFGSSQRQMNAQDYQELKAFFGETEQAEA